VELSQYLNLSNDDKERINIQSQFTKETTLRTAKYFFSLISLLTLTFILFDGCSSISVTQDYDPAYDFSKLKTFGFMPIPKDANINQINANRLGDAIKANLIARGYTLAEQADFGIALLFGKQTKTNIDSYGYGYGGYGSWGGIWRYGRRRCYSI
jgi:hypothetical protein